MDEEYDGSFGTAGALLLWQGIALVLAIMLGGMVIVAIVRGIYDLLK